MNPGKVFLGENFDQVVEFDASNIALLNNFYPRFSGVRFNQVISCQSSQTNSDLISNRIDRQILGIIRQNSDLIVTTGKTARDEKLNSSIHAPMLILTNEDYLDVPATSIQSKQNVFVTSDDDIYLNSLARGIGRVTGDLESWFRSVISQYEAIVLESGMTMAIKLENVIEEICLTVTGAESKDKALVAQSKFLEAFASAWQITQLIEIDSTWFIRLQRSIES